MAVRLVAAVTTSIAAVPLIELLAAVSVSVSSELAGAVYRPPAFTVPLPVVTAQVKLADVMGRRTGRRAWR